MGNGACAHAGDSFKNFRPEIASHGFSRHRDRPSFRRDTETSRAIDWAIAEDNRNDSVTSARSNTSRIAVMGQSCGGIQTFAVAADPRITLMEIWNSGILIPDPNRNGPAIEDVRKEQLTKVHSPIFFFTGDKSDVAYPNGLDDFQRLTTAPGIHAYKDGMGHGGTYREPNAGELGRIASTFFSGS